MKARPKKYVAPSPPRGAAGIAMGALEGARKAGILLQTGTNLPSPRSTFKHPKFPKMPKRFQEEGD